MERFVYLCNDQEFIKLIETFGENIKVEGDFFYFDNGYAVKSDQDNPNNEKDKFFNSFKPDNNDIIYISIHPGGTNEKQIRKELSKLNESFQSAKPKIFITYHGSLNKNATVFFDTQNPNENDLISLNKSIKDFLDFNDVNQIFNDFKLRLDILTTLVKEVQSKNGNTETDLFNKVFPKLNSDNLNELKEKLRDYGNQLSFYNVLDEKVRNKIIETYKTKKVGNDKINTEIFDLLKKLQEKDK